MHPNFFHWHGRVELKPETPILEPRWNAAAKVGEKISATEIDSLLQLILFPGAEPDFAKRFTEALVKIEPTFPLTGNTELLRVMAAAVVDSRFEKPTPVADALALGLRAAAFPSGRAEPVCQDVITRAEEYLAFESERMRPAIDPQLSEKILKQVETPLANLKKAAEQNNPQEIGTTTEALGRAVFGAVKESHRRLGEVIDRLTEESQFLWWLVGRRSSTLMLRRDKLTADAYALPAAAEAATRVTTLPPAASVESLLDESLAQCAKGGSASKPLLDFILLVDKTWAESNVKVISCPALTPLVALVAERKSDGKPDANSLKALRIPPKLKLNAEEVARQYFRELMFLRSLGELN